MKQADSIKGNSCFTRVEYPYKRLRVSRGGGGVLKKLEVIDNFLREIH